MAAGGTASFHSVKLTPGITEALASAFLEWLLIVMLFIDAFFSYLLTKFAHHFKLQTPCLWCSRLDHVLGNAKLKFYLDLICGNHKFEISSLVYCRAHDKLVDVHRICEGCLFSFSTINKSNAETYRLLVGKIGENAEIDLEEDQKLECKGSGNLTSSPRYCSCCNQIRTEKGSAQEQVNRKLATSNDAEFAIPFLDCSGGNRDHEQGRQNLSVPIGASHQKISRFNHTSHVRYAEVRSTSDTESEVSEKADDILCHETDAVRGETVIRTVEDAVFLSDELSTEKIIDHVSAPELLHFISNEKPVPVKPLDQTSASCVVAIEDGLEAPAWQQASGEEKLSPASELISVGISQSLTAGETHIDFPKESMNISSNVLSPLPNAGEIPFLESVESKLVSLGDIPQPSNDSETLIQASSTCECISPPCVTPSVAAPETLVEVSQERKFMPLDDVPLSLKETLLLAEVSEESCIIRNSQVEKVCTLESEAIFDCKSKSEAVKTNEISIETRPSDEASNGSIHIPSSLDLTDAYQLAVGNRGRQLSGLLPEHWFGKDSSRVSEDLKVLLSQLSPNRGFEHSMSLISPGISAASDELKSLDSSTYNGIQILQKRISLERNESCLESLDGSTVAEIEGESVVDRLKRQVEHDKKLLHALCKELELERNASADAANQALAMITRIQEEKAALHMEALQNIRMMEEQGEYDTEALQKTSELLAEKEKEIQGLEAELQFYRKKYPNESMSKVTDGSPCGLNGTETKMDC